MSRKADNKFSNNNDENKMEPVKVPFYYKIPIGVKAVFINYWLCGVVYFFVNMGLSNTLFGSNAIYSETTYLVLSLAGGAIYGLIYFFFGGFLIEAVEKVDGEAAPWVICHSRKFWAIWIDVAYGLVWGFVSNFCAGYLVAAIKNSGNESIYWMFREPFTFAFIGLAVSYLLIGIKDLIVYLYHKITHREV